MSFKYYKDQYDRNTDSEGHLPLISNKVDSTRAYEWEVQISIPGTIFGSTDYTLGAKRVNGGGMAVEKIQADRVNDKVFYPGKVTPDELTITFDNLKESNLLNKLYEVFQEVYDPTTGYFYPNGDVVPKGHIKVYQLDHKRSPISSTTYVGTFMRTWNPMDWDYSRNEFHEIECTFSYDFIVQDEA